MKREENQGVVRIDKDLLTQLETWLKTDDAKKKGFHSKAPFVNTSVRELLEKYASPRFEHLQFDENTIKLIDNEIPNGTQYVELFLENNIIMCSNCGITKCIHVHECWKDSNIKKILEKKQIKNLIQT